MLGKNKIKYIDSIIISMICLLTFGYLGVLREKQIWISAVCLVVLAILILFEKIRLRKPYIAIINIYIYIIASMVLFTRFQGLSYVIYFTIMCIIILLYNDYNFYKHLLSIFSKITLIFMVITIVNYFNKELILGNLDFLLSKEQIETIQFGQIWNGSSGLAGELSFNAFCLSVGFAIYFSKLISNKKNILLTSAYSIILILFLISISMTSKRSMLIVVPLVSMMMILVYVYNQRNNIIKLFTTLLIIVSPIFYKIFILDKLTELLQSGKGSSVLSNRELYWNIAIDMIKEKPFLGHGINSYDIRFNMLRGHSGFAGAHNSFLQVFAELGIIGFLLFISFILTNLIITFRSFNHCIRIKNSECQLLLSVSLFIQLICICVGLSESIFYQPQQMYMYGLACNIGYKIFLDLKQSNRRIKLVL